MTVIFKLQNPSVAASLFEGCTDTSIYSCLQGVLGAVYADHPEKPTSAMAIINVFVFFAGEPNAELVRFVPDSFENDFVFAVPQNEAWAKVIEQVWTDKAKKITRYAYYSVKVVTQTDRPPPLVHRGLKL